MPEITVFSREHQNLNQWSEVAENPFYGPTVLHPNPQGQIVASWVLGGFPDARATLISGNCIIGSAERQTPIRLEVEIEQGTQKSTRNFLVGNGRANRYGIAFLHDGSPYKLTFRASVEHPDDFPGSAFQIGPLECMNPINESLRPRLYRMTDQRGPALVNCNQGGLMNRIIPLMSAIQIARKTERTAYAWWGKNEHCAAEFHDVFAVDAATDPSLVADSYEVYANYEDTPPLELDRGRQHKLIHSIMPIRTMPVVQNDYASAAETFRTVPLAKPVEDKLARHDNLDLSRTIGFHIRRPYPNGAFAEMEQGKFTLRLEVFIDLIEKLRCALPEYDNVLLCTNSAEAESAVKEHFGSYIIINEKESIDNTTDVRAVQDAIVDLKLMSRCPVLFSQETTVFGLFAHAVGGNRLFSVTTNSTEHEYEFYEFLSAVHVHTIRTPKADIGALIDLIQGAPSPERWKAGG